MELCQWCAKDDHSSHGEGFDDGVWSVGVPGGQWVADFDRNEDVNWFLRSQSWLPALLAELQALQKDGTFWRNRVEMFERREASRQEAIHQYRKEIDARREADRAQRAEIALLRAANSMLLDVFRDHIDALPEDIRVKLRA